MIVITDDEIYRPSFRTSQVFIMMGDQNVPKNHACTLIIHFSLVDVSDDEFIQVTNSMCTSVFWTHFSELEEPQDIDCFIHNRMNRKVIVNSDRYCLSPRRRFGYLAFGRLFACNHLVHFHLYVITLNVRHLLSLRNNTLQ
jgi:hypothetical protein